MTIGRSKVSATEPWQQGLVILAILSLGSLLGLQRFRTTQHVINASALLTLIAIFLIGLAAVVWLLAGHASATNLNQPADWLINANNFSLFGIITLNFIGVSGPLNMAGEIKGARENNNRRYLTHDLLWGALIIFICYAVATISPLIVRGSAMLNAPVPPFEAFTAVNVTLGNVVAGITVIFMLFSFLAGATFYSYSSSRILMVVAIDQHIPTWFARLNKHRVPANAVIFQFLFSGAVTIAIFMVAPYVARFGGNAANTLIDLFNVNLASLTLIWTLATLFFFINIIFLYRRNPQHFRQYRILPMPIIWFSTAIGGIACILTIVASLIYSWIPQLIPNGTWWYVVGGLSAICLIIAMIGGMLARSEADWEATLKS
jgi:glutamate:GABA antiporter